LDSGLDAVRDQMCLAFVPLAAARWPDTLLAVPGCMHARIMNDSCHAVFRGAPEEVAITLRQALGTNGIRCMRAPLEELCVELMGADR